jgi:hypothetical protein
VGSDITQKQNKYEQADPEITCGTLIDEDTCKGPPTGVRNEPSHCPRGHVGAMGRGKIEMWEMRNVE